MDLIVKNIEKSKTTMKKKTKKNRMLVSINVVGSTGPIRFVVKEDETVKRVIDITLKCYAHQGRLPLFSSSRCTSSFLLYARCSLVQPLNPCAKIGSMGTRSFIIYKNQESDKDIDEVSADTNMKNSGKWKAWLNKSLDLVFPFLK